MVRKATVTYQCERLRNLTDGLELYAIHGCVPKGRETPGTEYLLRQPPPDAPRRMNDSVLWRSAALRR